MSDDPQLCLGQSRFSVAPRMRHLKYHFVMVLYLYPVDGGGNLYSYLLAIGGAYPGYAEPGRIHMR